MRYLLDTSVWLWSLEDPQRLSRRAQEIFEDRSHEVFLSAATAWEIAIKAASGKLKLPQPPPSLIPRCMAEQGLQPLPVTHQHALAVFALPPHHRDPFDRLLIAQANIEEMILITPDRMFGKYPVQILWAE